MGGVVIYKDAEGKGKLYQDKDFNYYWPPGYDSQGNVYVEGRERKTEARPDGRDSSRIQKVSHDFTLRRKDHVPWVRTVGWPVHHGNRPGV